MDSELYDEFSNYIGPELESDESDEGEEQGKDDLQVGLFLKDKLSVTFSAISINSIDVRI